MAYINNIYFEFEIWYLQSPIEKKAYKFISTIEEMNKSIDRMRDLNLTILEITCKGIIRKSEEPNL